jgi:hypothetical protein
MNHRTGHQQDGWKTAARHQKRQEQACQRYLGLQALIATHENASNPDYIYIKQLEHRRDMLKKQLINAGLFDPPPP